jgi:hypothetical protein
MRCRLAPSVSSTPNEGWSPFQSGRITTIRLPESVTKGGVAPSLACTFGAPITGVSLAMRRQNIQLSEKIILEIGRGVQYGDDEMMGLSKHHPIIPSSHALLITHDDCRRSHLCAAAVDVPDQRPPSCTLMEEEVEGAGKAAGGHPI